MHALKYLSRVLALLVLTTLVSHVLFSSTADAQEPPPPPSTADAQTADDWDTGGAPPPPPPVDDMTESDSDTRQVESGSTSDSEAYEYWDTKPQRPQTGKRISLEGLGGMGGMAGGYLVGGFGGALVGALINPDPFSALLGALIGGATGGLLGTPLGIWGAGNSVDGNGSYAATLGGTALGFAATAGISAALEERAPGIGAISSVVLPITGGIIAYELSNSGPDRSSALRKPGLRLNAGISRPRQGTGAIMVFGASW